MSKPTRRPTRRSVPEQLSLTWVAPFSGIELPIVPEGALLSSAQASFRVGLNATKGTHCGCCGKYGKRYKRTLNSTMVRGLIWLVRMAGADREWINIQDSAPAWLMRSKQLATLRYWGLVERKWLDPTEAGKRRSGVFRPTTHGIDFVYGRLRVPRQCYEYRGQVDGYSAEETNVRESLGKKFDYYELMGWER